MVPRPNIARHLFYGTAALFGPVVFALIFFFEATNASITYAPGGQVNPYMAMEVTSYGVVVCTVLLGLFALAACAIEMSENASRGVGAVAWIVPRMGFGLAIMVISWVGAAAIFSMCTAIADWVGAVAMLLGLMSGRNVM